MDNDRMSTADMLQYCNEALAWEDFGPIDIFFFESVKKILLGQASVFEEPEEQIDDLMGIERPVRDIELEPDYPQYANLYYGEEGDDEIPDYSHIAEEEAFSAAIFGDGFFEEDRSPTPLLKLPQQFRLLKIIQTTTKLTSLPTIKASQQPEGGSFTVKI